MQEKKRILAISGSIRDSSSNIRILKAIARMLETLADVEIYEGIAGLPFFDPAIPEEQRPQQVLDFIKKIENTDAVIISTPEYVFSLPAVLKNALEWTVATTVFSSRPTAFIVASANGEKAFESLDIIMRTLVQEEIPRDQKLLIKGSQVKIDESSRFTDSQVEQSVRLLLEALLRRLS